MFRMHCTEHRTHTQASVWKFMTHVMPISLVCSENGGSAFLTHFHNISPKHSWCISSLLQVLKFKAIQKLTRLGNYMGRFFDISFAGVISIKL